METIISQQIMTKIALWEFTMKTKVRVSPSVFATVDKPRKDHP